MSTWVPPIFKRATPWSRPEALNYYDIHLFVVATGLLFNSTPPHHRSVSSTLRLSCIFFLTATLLLAPCRVTLVHCGRLSLTKKLWDNYAFQRCYLTLSECGARQARVVLEAAAQAFFFRLRL